METKAAQSNVVSFGPRTDYFLSIKKESTRKTYTAAFQAFQAFYKAPVDEFLLRVDEFNRRPLKEREKPYDEPILEEFRVLLEKSYSNKTVRTYMGALQGVAKKYKIMLSLADINLPPDDEEVETHVWTDADSVAKFLGLFKVDVYRVVGIVMFQSGLSIGDTLGLKYGSISDELEKGIVPLCLDFQKAGRSKTGVRFITFCGQWSTSSIKAFLRDKKLRPEDRIFGKVWKEEVESYFRSRAREFLPEKWEGRNPCSPHSLRHGFRSVVHASGLVTDENLEQFMGHGHRTENRMANEYTDLDVSTWRELFRPALKVLEPSLNFSPCHNPKIPIAL
jgi:integrase